VELQIALSAFLYFLLRIAAETCFPRLKQHVTQALVKRTNESSRWRPLLRSYFLLYLCLSSQEREIKVQEVAPITSAREEQVLFLNVTTGHKSDIQTKYLFEQWKTINERKGTIF
jgi:hypothetical protein